jgi:hypothetical protein
MLVDWVVSWVAAVSTILLFTSEVYVSPHGTPLSRPKVKDQRHSGHALNVQRLPAAPHTTVLQVWYTFRSFSGMNMSLGVAQSPNAPVILLLLTISSIKSTSCVLWLKYGVMNSDRALIIANLIGSAFILYCIHVFYSFSSTKVSSSLPNPHID